MTGTPETLKVPPMSSEYTGIEEARARLGDLVTAAGSGIDTIITRNRRPVARITRIEEDTMPTTALISPLSDGTAAAVAAVVEYTIQHEHGTADRDAMVGARILALSGVQTDVARAYIDRNNGDDRGLAAYADTVLRQLVRDVLAARRCQCPLISTAGHVGRCEGHYEVDVPAVNGLRVCGTCYAHKHPETTVYTVLIEAGNDEGTAWEALGPAENVTDPGNPDQVALDVFTNQNVITDDQSPWRIRVWNGADADTAATKPIYELDNQAWRDAIADRLDLAWDTRTEN